MNHQGTKDTKEGTRTERTDSRSLVASLASFVPWWLFLDTGMKRPRTPTPPAGIGAGGSGMLCEQVFLRDVRFEDLATTYSPVP